MLYIVKKYAKSGYRKVKRKFKKGKSNSITNNDLYKIALLSSTQQKEHANERFRIHILSFLVFLILCVLYVFNINTF